MVDLLAPVAEWYVLARQPIGGSVLAHEPRVPTPLPGCQLGINRVPTAEWGRLDGEEHNKS